MLATTFSHEMLTPLNTIVNQTRMLIDCKEELCLDLMKYTQSNDIQEKPRGL